LKGAEAMFGVGSLAAYQPIIQVGEGAYGCVYRALDKRNGEIVALKRLLFHKPSAGFPLCAVREIKLLKSLQHKNIVKLKDIITSKGCEHLDVQVKTDIVKSQPVNAGDPQSQSQNSQSDRGDTREVDIVSSLCGNLYLVFEYIEHDLAGLIEAKYKFSQRSIKCIMKQLYEVLDYLSSTKIVHRDIKSSNILISNDFHVKLADFGLARSFESADGTEERVQLTNNVVTIWYKPPELLLGATRYTNAVDTWSAGCVHAELEMGRPLFPGKTEVEQLDYICRAVGTPSDETWPAIVELPHYEMMIANLPSTSRHPSTNSFRSIYAGKLSDSLVSLLERVFVCDPKRRTSARIVLSHSYFLTNPLPPTDPAELGRVATDDAPSMHEYETKLKRKRKAEEEKAEKEKLGTVSGDGAPPIFNATGSLVNPFLG
jgi:cyclin-dependent kinase 12/13